MGAFKFYLMARTKRLSHSNIIRPQSGLIYGEYLTLVLDFTVAFPSTRFRLDRLRTAAPMCAEFLTKRVVVRLVQELQRRLHRAADFPQGSHGTFTGRPVGIAVAPHGLPFPIGEDFRQTGPELFHVLHTDLLWEHVPAVQFEMVARINMIGRVFYRDPPHRLFREGVILHNGKKEFPALEHGLRTAGGEFRRVDPLHSGKGGIVLCQQFLSTQFGIHAIMNFPQPFRNCVGVVRFQRGI